MQSKITKKIINLLKSDAEYYGGIGKQFLSNSDIGTLLKNPTMYGVPQPDNKAFIMGRYFHCKMLEPEKVDEYLIAPVMSRTAKAYKEFCADHLIPFALLKNEKQKVDEWCDVMLSNFDFYELIQDKDNKYEEPNVKNIGELNGGALWKGKADIVHKDYIIGVTREVSIKWNKLLRFTTNTFQKTKQKISSHIIYDILCRLVYKLKRKRTHYVIYVPLEHNNVLDYNKCVIQTIELMEQNLIIKNKNYGTS